MCIRDRSLSLTKVGESRIKALRKCRDDFKKLHLPDVVGSYSKKDMDDAYDKGFKDAMIKYRKD
jgi:hypothetical protein